MFIIMHIGLIPDGNRRFAKANNLSVEEAYKKGFKTMVDLIDNVFMTNNSEYAIIDSLTIYVCSVDNLTKRNQVEVESIHRMIESFIQYYKARNMPTLRVNIIGNTRYLPDNLRRKLRRIQKKTVNYVGNTLNLAIGYDAYQDMIHYSRKTIQNSGVLSRREFKRIHPVKDMDIVIRTGYERRISGFFPFQISYAELFFLDKYFPEFTKEDLREIIRDYNKRQRRFGC